MTYKCPNCRAELDVVEVLPVRESKPQVQPQSGGGADAAGAPYGRDHYGYAFKTQAEADDYFARVAAWENRPTGEDAVGQATLLPGAQDVRAMDLVDLKWVCENLDAVSRNHGRTHGPVDALQALAHWLDYGISDDGSGHVVPPAGFPILAQLTVDEAKALKDKAGANRP
jgi:hypothetical protein